MRSAGIDVALLLAVLAGACGGNGERAGTTEGEARDSASVAAVASDTGTVAAGTSFSVRLNETLSARTHRVGDAFTAVARDGIAGANGGLLVPAGTIVRGRITQVTPPGVAAEAAVIKLAFESISFAGRTLPLQGTVVRAEPERRGPAADTSAAARAATGGVLGAEAAEGSVLAAATGTAIALGTAEVDVVVPAGSELVIRLDAPLELR